jgi:hypothetical protein
MGVFLENQCYDIFSLNISNMTHFWRKHYKNHNIGHPGWWVGGNSWRQGCQMVSFQTKNPNLGKFSRAFFFGKRLVYSLAILNLIRPFGNLVAIWYTFPSFGTLRREKSGNLGWRVRYGA